MVGVARDSKVNGLNEKPTPFLYLPEYQVYRTDRPGGSTMIIIARTTGDPLALGKTVENAIHDLNADLVVFDVTTLELRQQIASFGQRVAGTFVGAFGLLALVLAAVGIYGVTAYTTRQRTHEIGIRMALGASQNNILRLVIGHGLRLTIIGVVLGLAASFALDALSAQHAPGRDEHRCADLFERGDLALRGGAVCLLHPRAPRDARGPECGAAL